MPEVNIPRERRLMDTATAQAVALVGGFVALRYL